MNSTTEARALKGLERLHQAVVNTADQGGADIASEVIELGAYMLRTRPDRTVARHVSRDGDSLAALRLRIDERISRLGTGFEDDDEDAILALTADLVTYRIALWNAPVPYEMANKSNPYEMADKSNPSVEEFAVHGEDGLFAVIGEVLPHIQVVIHPNGACS